MNPKVLDVFKVANSIPEGIKLLQKQVPWTAGMKPAKAPEAEGNKRLQLVA